MAESAKVNMERMEEEAKEVREAELNDKWNKFMVENELTKQQIIQQLMEASLLRNSKGKKKGKKGKKKGWEYSKIETADCCIIWN